MEGLEKAILENRYIRQDEALEKHADWVDEIRAKYSSITEENVEQILQDEI